MVSGIQTPAVERADATRAHTRRAWRPSVGLAGLGLFALLGVLYPLLPGHPSALSSGLPLTTLWLLAPLALVSFVLALARPGHRWLAFAALLLLLLGSLKLASGWDAPPPGLVARYTVPQDGPAQDGQPLPPLEPAVERSTDFLWLRDATRLDQRLGLGDTAFPLHFLNDSRRWPPDLKLRTALPFQVSWDGWLRVPQSRPYHFWLSASGPALLRLDGQEVLRSRSRGDRADQDLVLPLPAGLVPLHLEYQRLQAQGLRLRLEWDASGDRETIASPFLLADTPGSTAPGSTAPGELPLAARLGQAADALYLLALLGALGLLLVGHWRRPRASAGLPAPWNLLERPLLALLPSLTFLLGTSKLGESLDRVLLLPPGPALRYETEARALLLDGPTAALAVAQTSARAAGSPLNLPLDLPYAAFLALAHRLAGEPVAAVLALQMALLGVLLALAYLVGCRLLGLGPALLATLVLLVLVRSPLAPSLDTLDPSLLLGCLGLLAAWPLVAWPLAARPLAAQHAAAEDAAGDKGAPGDRSPGAPDKPPPSARSSSARSSSARSSSARGSSARGSSRRLAMPAIGWRGAAAVVLLALLAIPVPLARLPLLAGLAALLAWRLATLLRAPLGQTWAWAALTLPPPSLATAGFEPTDTLGPDSLEATSLGADGRRATDLSFRRTDHDTAQPRAARAESGAFPKALAGMALASRVNWALLVILLVAAAVRLWGVAWQMPWQLHPDEDKYAGAALGMLRTGDLNPHYFKNPALLTYWLAAQFWLTGAAATLLGWVASPAALWSGPDESGAYVVDRVNVALLGTATVGATYALGRLTLGKLPALLGAAFLALCFLHARDSHYGVSDVPMALPLVASTIFAVRLARRPTLRDYLLAGALGGLATATKYSAGLFVATLLVAHLVAWRRDSLGAPALRLLAAAGLLSGVAFLAAAPFTLLDWGAFVEEFRRQYGKGEAPKFGQAADPVPVLYLTTLIQGMGLPQVLLAVWGALILALRSRRSALLLGAFPLAYLAFMLPKPLFFVRLAIPLLPFLCLLAAAGCCALVARLVALRYRPLALGALVVLALALPTLRIVQHNLIIGQEDTRILASRWAVQHLAGQGDIAIDNSGLSAPPGQQAGLEILDEVRIHRHDLKFYLDHDVRFLATSSFIQGRYWVPTTELYKEDLEDDLRLIWPDERDNAQYLERHFTPIAVFAPGPGNTDVPYAFDDIFTPYWNLDQWERPGPTIKIYRLDPGG